VRIFGRAFGAIGGRSTLRIRLEAGIMKVASFQQGFILFKGKHQIDISHLVKMMRAADEL
jgi:hypothetical protein